MEQPRKHPTEGCVGPAAESVGVRALSPKAAPTAPPPLRSARPRGRAAAPRRSQNRRRRLRLRIRRLHELAGSACRYEVRTKLWGHLIRTGRLRELAGSPQADQAQCSELKCMLFSAQDHSVCSCNPTYREQRHPQSTGAVRPPIW